MQNQSWPREARKVNIESGLDSYYPFDPFDLPRTGEVIESLYWTYGDVAVDASDDEDSSDEDEDEEEEDEEDDSDDDDVVMGTSAMSRHRNIDAGQSLKIPKPASFGKGAHGTSLDRRKALRDGGVLSTSFEGMSISPVRAGLTGRA
jgi:RNA polymerase I-specific transcription initiation factor RRN3